jgi:AraC-like DNA-binding protein
MALRDELATRVTGLSSARSVGRTAARLIQLHGGRISIDVLVREHGLSRQQFARTFYAGVGIRPKLFARITRFQALVRALLSTDASQWASLSSAVGFYDQAHMINEFRGFAGSLQIES